MPTSANLFDDQRRRADAAFREKGGIMRMAEALRAGVHRRTLYALRDAGVLQQLGRGLYRLADAPPLSHPDFVAVSQRARGRSSASSPRSVFTA